MTCSAQENIVDTLKGHLDSLHYDDEEINKIAEAIVDNLTISNTERYPKWGSI